MKLMATFLGCGYDLYMMNAAAMIALKKHPYLKQNFEVVLYHLNIGFNDVACGRVKREDLRFHLDELSDVAMAEKAKNEGYTKIKHTSRRLPRVPEDHSVVVLSRSDNELIFDCPLNPACAF